MKISAKMSENVHQLLPSTTSSMPIAISVA